MEPLARAFGKLHPHRGIHVWGKPFIVVSIYAGDVLLFIHNPADINHIIQETIRF